MAAHSSEHSNTTELEEESAAEAILYPNAFGISLKEGEQPRKDVALKRQLPSSLEPLVHFHRFREPLEEGSSSRDAKMQVLWKASPETMEKAHHLVYYYFGSKRVTEEGCLEVIPLEERIAPPNCFLTTNPCAPTELDTSAAAVNLFWECDIKIGAGQIHCVTASSAQETTDSVPVLNSISSCGNKSGGDVSSSSGWQTCPCNSATWLLDDHPDIDACLPEHEGGDSLNVVLGHLEDVMCVTKSPNVAFEVALCYCLLCENALVYDRIFCTKTDYDAICTIISECDGLVADLFRCESAVVRMAEKRKKTLGGPYWQVHIQQCFFEALEWYDKHHPIV